MAELQNSDIQGFVLSSYSKNMPCANYVLLRINEVSACLNWLKEITPQITNGLDRKTNHYLNIAFTCSAFQKIGYSEADLSTFSVAFQEGMSAPNRQKILSDDGSNAPENWSWGNDKKPVDILLLVFASDEEELQQQLTLLQARANLSSGVEIVQSLYAGRQPNSHEHFGFLDGIGQPVIEGTDRKVSQLKRTGHATEVKAGEFILGYENEMQKVDPMPRLGKMPEFGRNGTYLVFRQLEQHVDKFWNYIKMATTDKAGQSLLIDQERMAAKIVGRWKSGAPINKYPNADPASSSGSNEENSFGFATEDKVGFGCPLGAHIRRINPRDSLFDNPALSLLTLRRHRIIRRGRSYGHRTEDVYKNDGKERGLHFICINSNIERQFEFIQQTWVNNRSFAALNYETDPLIGHHSALTSFSIQGRPARTRVHNLDDFITLMGGAYFFMPGIKGLIGLAKG
jgi:Dyp-type peroxidase family